MSEFIIILSFTLQQLLSNKIKIFVFNMIAVGLLSEDMFFHRDNILWFVNIDETEHALSLILRKMDHIVSNY